MPGIQQCVYSNNKQMYAIRRIRDAFRENKNIKDSEKIEELVNKAKANLEIIHRQVTIGQLYSTQKLVIESPGNT
ncbi:PREDICTED: LYR motif-containing protein 4 [Phaethon lepturus]|uniref:LYR motif-containing protein 4 n=1 Tax=Phaethon lepturus TaxID=97097 RepID=UPI0005309CD4|nr:PREDICTED: LYR motif-containing protein 4 [Phaethon lepturus]